MCCRCSSVVAFLYSPKNSIALLRSVVVSLKSCCNSRTFAGRSYSCAVSSCNVRSMSSWSALYLSCASPAFCVSLVLLLRNVLFSSCNESLVASTVSSFR